MVESLCEGISAENADEDSLARLRAEFDILETSKMRSHRATMKVTVLNDFRVNTHYNLCQAIV